MTVLSSRMYRPVVSMAVIAVASLLFYALQHQLTTLWVDLTLRPEVREALGESLHDQKTLYRLDSQNAAAYHARFERIRKMLARMTVLDLSRHDMASRYETALVSVFVATLLATGVIAAGRARRDDRRLAVLQTALQALSRGERSVRVADRRRDLIGRIGRMVEETSSLVGRQQQQLEYLDHLSQWQEAARRHSHEIRGPLTAARLEIDRLISSSSRGVPEGELRQIGESVCDELDRLSRFTREFSSFATIGAPRLATESLLALVGEFEETFRTAWPNLTLQPPEVEERLPPVLADRDLLRQVLVNLCTNASQAMAEGGGSIAFRLARAGEQVRLDVADDGPGIAERVRERLFAPYVTTRRIGEGMGLGLAISRKVVLDHGGDLELIESSPSGATFRITLRIAEREP